MRRRFISKFIAASAAIGMVSLAGSAMASGNACGVSGATSASFGSYNPFSGSGMTNVPVTLVLNRYILGSAKTQTATFYLERPAGAPSGYDVLYQGVSVLHTLPDGQTLPSSGTIFHDFGGTGHPDSASFLFLVTLPPGQDLPSGQPLVYDLRYVCKGTGGLADVKNPVTSPSAIVLQVNVLSALQASFVGAPLAFGEIGAVADADAQSHTASASIRVASSAPYRVALTSANGYRMTYPGGSLGVASQTVKYQVRFLGQTRDSITPAFSPVVCARAGLAGQFLPITARLAEGGVGKVPSAAYRDTITVTVTPLAADYGTVALGCPGL